MGVEVGRDPLVIGARGATALVRGGSFQDGPRNSGIATRTEAARDARLPCGHVGVRTAMVSGPVLTRNRYSGMTMDRFATGLSGSLGRPVFDRTGLTGNFDIELNYIVERPTGPGFSPRPEGAPAPNGVSLRDAITQQLGLDLRSERGPVEYFVIDAIERPKSN